MTRFSCPALHRWACCSFRAATDTAIVPMNMLLRKTSREERWFSRKRSRLYPRNFRCDPRRRVSDEPQLLLVESRSLEEFSGAGATQKFIVFHQDTAAREHHVGHTRHLNSFEHGIVHAHVMSLYANRVRAIG